MQHRSCWALVFVALSSGACSDDTVHVFGAHRYDASRDCLESAAAVDVIEGADPGTCNALMCWISPSEEIYLTTSACDAPIGYVDHTGDPEMSLCAIALAAYGREGHGICT